MGRHAASAPRRFKATVGFLMATELQAATRVRSGSVRVSQITWAGFRRKNHPHGRRPYWIKQEDPWIFWIGFSPTYVTRMGCTYGSALILSEVVF